MRIQGKLVKKIKERYNYEGFKSLPNSRATKEIIPGCLVLEGGAFRGLYTQGVLDFFMENSLNFQSTIGVSAGALAGLNYVSGQIGRSARINIGHRHESEYIGIKAFRHSKSPLNLDYLLQKFEGIEDFDFDRFMDSNRDYIAVATNCHSGLSEYFSKKTCKDILLAAKASASMPYFAKMVDIAGEKYLDGGISDNIPFGKALVDGHKKIVVVKTRDRSYRKTKDRVNKLAKRVYGDYPALVEALTNSTSEYNNQMDKLEMFEKIGLIFVIAPSERVDVNLIEPDVTKLGKLYELGYNDARNEYERLLQYLYIDKGKKWN